MLHLAYARILGIYEMTSSSSLLRDDRTVSLQHRGAEGQLHGPLLCGDSTITLSRASTVERLPTHGR
jgi:hypothetical protein